MTNSLRIEKLSGKPILKYLPAVAQLRLEIFRDFPYLYDGTLAYEEKYLSTYANAPECLFILVLDGDEVVGASTALPLEYEMDEVQQPFIAQGYTPQSLFYFGESVLKKAYRGKGIGVRFFQEREAYAKALGRFEHISFCAVERPVNHARRPPDYMPLDNFWRKRGYTKHPELHTQFSWKELDEIEESPKKMVFWMKRLTE
jgi:GNAT superfamily N-acetyltransferase